MDMSEGMQEAMHRSNLDMRCVHLYIYAGLLCQLMYLSFTYLCFPDEFSSSSSSALDVSLFLKLNLRDCLLVVGSGAEYVRKEIPLHVVHGLSLLKLDSPLSSFTDLQRVIYEEEKAAYLEAMSQNIR